MALPLDPDLRRRAFARVATCYFTALAAAIAAGALVADQHVLLGIHLFPTVLVYLGCLPLYAVFYAPARPLSWLDLLAAVVITAAIWIEARADRELHAFRQSRLSSAQMLATGVWSWCRHPNYLGELGFWFGLFAFALAASSDAWWTGTGIAAMALLFAGISIPMQERKLAADKPEYGLWRKRSFALLPLSRFREKLRRGTA